MAGGFILKSTNKNKNAKPNGPNNEVLRESSANKPKKLTLAGILGLNQTVEINKQPQKQENAEKDFIKNFLNQLQKEQQVLVDHKQLEIKQEIKALQEEIKKLNNASEELDHEVTQATLANVVDSSEYQLNFLLRLKKLIVSLRENVSEACQWLDCFNSKKKKKNCFWNNAKKDKGGSQYLQSGEHSASRSAN